MSGLGVKETGLDAELENGFERRWLLNGGFNVSAKWLSRDMTRTTEDGNSEY